MAAARRADGLSCAEGGGPRIPLHSPEVSHSEEEHLGVGAASLEIMWDELPITDQMKKKRQTTTEHPSYMEVEETQEEDWESREDEESRSSGEAPGDPSL